MSVRTDVDRGLEIIEQTDELKKELTSIEKRLEKAALEGEQIELEDPEREGRQHLAMGTSLLVPIVLTADLVVQSFKDGSKTHTNIALSAGAHLREFYVPEKKWVATTESGKQFRHLAKEVLGEKAPSFINVCLARDKDGIPKSAIKIEWKRAR